MSTSEPREEEVDAGDDVVNPFQVTAGDSGTGVDYEAIVEKFGCSMVTEELLERFEAVTGEKPHPWLSRGLYYAHRDFDKILSMHEKGVPFFLYTGRGPSGEMHLGHLIPFMFNAYLQKVFEVPLVIQLTDDEKYLFRPELRMADVHRFMDSNLKDIIACGFDPARTFIFADLEYIQPLYSVIVRIQKCLTLNQVRGCFGFTESQNIGIWGFPPIQMAPCFSVAFPEVLVDPDREAPEDVFAAECEGAPSVSGLPCLIPCAIDQDPYFRLTRGIARRLNWRKPCGIYAKFIPGLKGIGAKMSTSDPTSCIMLTDTPEEIETKIKKYAKSGGGASMAEHRAHGANLAVDVAYQYLTFFLEDDFELMEIRDQYGAGEMLTGEVKQRLVTVLQKVIGDFQQRRAAITPEYIRRFTDRYPRVFGKKKMMTEEEDGGESERTQ